MSTNAQKYFSLAAALDALDEAHAENQQSEALALHERNCRLRTQAENQQLRDAVEQAYADLESILPPRDHEELAQGVYFAHLRIEKAIARINQRTPSEDTG